MSTFVRAALVVLGLLLMLAGLALIVAIPGVGLAGLQLVGFGAFLVVIVTIERHRYRSVTAERTHAAPGPGGGEPAGVGLEPRFRSTSEVFIDPTTGVRMRVAVDPSSGERRYVPES
jgi:hypothetical protein